MLIKKSLSRISLFEAWRFLINNEVNINSLKPSHLILKAASLCAYLQFLLASILILWYTWNTLDSDATLWCGKIGHFLISGFCYFCG